MTKKAADLSKMLARKGEAKPSATKDNPQKVIDGRSLRRTDRIQWNLKVKPETRVAAFEAAQREGRTLGEIVEDAIALYVSDS